MSRKGTDALFFYSYCISWCHIVRCFDNKLPRKQMEVLTISCWLGWHFGGNPLKSDRFVQPESSTLKHQSIFLSINSMESFIHRKHRFFVLPLQRRAYIVASPCGRMIAVTWHFSTPGGGTRELKWGSGPGYQALNPPGCQSRYSKLQWKICETPVLGCMSESNYVTWEHVIIYIIFLEE